MPGQAKGRVATIISATAEEIERRRIELGDGQHLFWSLLRQRIQASAQGMVLDDASRANHAGLVRRAFMLHLDELASGKVNQVDREMARWLSVELRAIDGGEDSAILTPPKKGRGNQGTQGKSLTFSKVIALRFIDVCRRWSDVMVPIEGEPEKLVCDLYGITSNGLKGWGKADSASSIVDPEEPTAGDIDGFADYYAGLRDLLEMGSNLYKREGGRSAGAIRERNTKRRNQVK